jgi:hypothetical protein
MRSFVHCIGRSEGNTDLVEIFMSTNFRDGRLRAILFGYAREVVVARSFLRDFTGFRSAVAVCHHIADGLLPLSA